MAAAPAPGLAGPLYAFAACGCYMTLGPLLILLNNHILHGLHFPYPIALSALGVTFSAACCRLLTLTRLVPLTRPELAQSRAFFWRTTLPLAALAALTLALGNAAYMHLTVGTCQILKALTPAITLGLSYALRLEEPRAPVVGCVLLMCCGTAVAARGEIALPRLGLLLQLSANLAEAVRVVLAQRLLSAGAGAPLPLVEMMHHVAPYQSLCLLAASAAVELDSAEHRARAADAVLGAPLAFLGASALGLGLQFGALLAIKVAGSVTMKLLGIARNGSLVLFQAARGAEALAPRQLGGHAASTCAFVIYTLLRLGYFGGGGGGAAKQKAQ